MAKQIKAIKCPHCGSTQNTLIKADHYRCENCNTEYFLDNDDVNVNINHQYNLSNTNSDEQPTRAVKVSPWGFIAISAVIIAIIGYGLLTNNTGKQPTRTSQPATPPLVTKTNKDTVKNTTQMCDISADSTNNTITSVRLMYRTYGNSYDKDDRNSYVINFSDLVTGKTIAEQSLNLKKVDSFRTFNEWSFRTFDDGLLYAIYNENRVYVIDIKDNSVEDITQQLITQHPKLQSGIATIGFVHAIYGSGFSILTNNGQQVFYYPLVNKLFEKEDEFYLARKYFENVPKDSGINKLQFAFSDPKLSNAPQELPIELLKISYTDYPNGPKELINYVTWWRGYDKETRQKVDATTKYRIIYDSDAYRVKDFKVLAAGRLFFAPRIFYTDQQNLIIKSKVNAAPNALYNTQQLDINTGEVIWTIPSDKLKIDAIYPYGKQQFIAKSSCMQYSIIDATGVVVKTLTLPE